MIRMEGKIRSSQCCLLDSFISPAYKLTSEKPVISAKISRRTCFIMLHNVHVKPKYVIKKRVPMELLKVSFLKRAMPSFVDEN